MFGIGLPEMIVILAVALIVVGPDKLPDMARSVAKWVLELKKTVNQVFVKHGRYICIKNPRCWACPVREHCAFTQKNLARPKNAEEILEDMKKRELVLEQLREQAVSYEH